MIDQDYLYQLTERYLKDLIADIGKVSLQKLESHSPFGELGVDSFFVLKIIKRLEQDFGQLPKTLLFEHFNIHDLAQFFIKKHQSVLLNLFQSHDLKTSNESNRATPDLVCSAPKIQENHTISAQSTQVEPMFDLNQPLCIKESDALANEPLKEIVENLYASFKNESSVSRGTRTIAPNLFIGSKGVGYFNYSRCKDILLAYGFTGPKEAFKPVLTELIHHCQKNQLSLNLFYNLPITWVEETAFSATPFGVMQRINELQTFTLEGGKMRRLRYQVSKFEKEGNCYTSEYRCGSAAETDTQIALIIDAWASERPMVNPLIFQVKDEILQGKLNPEHRIFLTYLDDKLQNAILISPLAGDLNGYLMDLEFYSREMPLGGLEYAIANIIQTLVNEGKTLLSLGGTYGCKIEESPNPDSGVEQVLNTLREQNIFNDEGNFQFKNKFRPDNESIFLCRPVEGSNPDNVIDIIMMIADPIKMQTVDEHLFDPSTPSHSTSAVSTAPKPITLSSPNPGTEVASEQGAIEGLPRSQWLAQAGYNPLNLSVDQVELDLKTDSWSQLHNEFITQRMQALRGGLQRPPEGNAGLESLFPFEHITLTASGRDAESVLFSAIEKKGVLLQNILFPTTLFHQIDKGFHPVEIPSESVFHLDSSRTDKGEIDFHALKEYLSKDPKSIALVCVELNNNAAGGLPFVLGQLQALKHHLVEFQIPLFMDVTRVIENAYASLPLSQVNDVDAIWATAREMMSYADVVFGSLTKDFCVNKGGIIATNSQTIFSNVVTRQRESGKLLDPIDQRLVGLAFKNQRYLVEGVVKRIQATQKIWQRLEQSALPVVHPVGTHAILLDIKCLVPFNQLQYPVPSFLAWLFENTGIRAAAHNVGMQKSTSLNDLVRIAVPVGMSEQQIRDIETRLVNCLINCTDVLDLEIDQQPDSASSGDHRARYKLSQIIKPTRTRISNEQTLNQATVDSSSFKTPAVKGHTTDNNTNSDQDGSIVPRPLQRETTNSIDEVAIIGIAGRYPKAPDLQSFWKNLVESKDCIDLVPEQRFELRQKGDRTQRYRGGFVDDIDVFDSLFFNISPREAETLDPQERLFLEVAWEALEDAGYTPETLVGDLQDRRVGVYVGAVWALYQNWGSEQRAQNNSVVASSFLWSLANRVSYFMNFSGPSMAVDTACSASLTALQLAWDAVRKGDCPVALVGGVNLDVHQCKQDITYAGGLLSEDGLCRTFGEGANGYVPGEGIGALLLKPLAKARQDGDNIYGVIKGININHGGKTSGYSVPNPKAQGDLVAATLEQSNIDPRSISYIEAHGTGTDLGDPIEITGLTQAFDRYGVAPQTCRIGSVKTNIGHLEAAAGIAGLTKVLLQMRAKTLVPSLHSAKLNPHIDFQSSPFVVQQQLEPWRAPIIEGKQLPLRAGISSFGAGGSNAHVILESYESSANNDAKKANTKPLVFPISARTEDQLKIALNKLIQFVQHNADDSQLSGMPSVSLENIAFTLQVGRKHFDQRVAIIAVDSQSLLQGLSDCIEGRSSDLWVQGAAKGTEQLTKWLSRKEKDTFMSVVLADKDSRKVAQLWVDGVLSDLQSYALGNPGQRVSLPTYPFAKKHHWLPLSGSVPSLSAGPVLHPMIDANASTFNQQIFKKRFSDQEFFIYDHLVSRIPTLPGVGYLDWARKAGELATGQRVKMIKNIVWVSPLTVPVGGTTDAEIELSVQGENVQFDIYRLLADGNRHLCSQGKLLFTSIDEEHAPAEYIDIAAVKARTQPVTHGQQAYPLFSSLGLDLGPSFQVLKTIYKNSEEILGELNLSAERIKDLDNFLLHPSLVDGSFQAVMAAQLGEKTGEMFVPYSLGEVEILHPLTPNCFSYVQLQSGEKKSGRLSKTDVFILDESGKILVKVRESVGVPLVSVHEKPSASSKSVGNSQTTDIAVEPALYAPIWVERPCNSAVSKKSSDLVQTLWFDRDNTRRNAFSASIGDANEGYSLNILVIPGEKFSYLGDQTFAIDPLNSADYEALFAACAERQWAFNQVVYAWTLENAELNDSVLLERDGTYPHIDPIFYLAQSLQKQKRDRKAHWLVLASETKGLQGSLLKALSGFLKVFQMENTKFSTKLCLLNPSETETAVLNRWILEELTAATDDVLVRRAQDQRWINSFERRDWNPFVPDEHNAATAVLRTAGTYVISGGMGGLGLIFARYLAKNYQANLVLSGRSNPSDSTDAIIKELESLGGHAVYVAADMSDRYQVASLIESALAKFGHIHGVIHSAGLLKDSYLKNKTLSDFHSVLNPKIKGTWWLDEATAGQPLDFFVVFSSFAAVVGNLGQSDYAYANAFMDAFIDYRESQRSAGIRSGRSRSINWSIWADGGMQLDEQTAAFFQKNLGISPLTNDVGLSAFVQVLQGDLNQLAVLEGNPEKIERAWGISSTEEQATSDATVSTASAPVQQVDGASTSNDELMLKVQKKLVSIVMELLKLDAADVDLDAILLDLGFDSIGLTTFSNKLNQFYGLDVTPVLFFEYPNIRETARHFAEAHTELMQQKHAVTGASARAVETAPNTKVQMERQHIQNKASFHSSVRINNSRASENSIEIKRRFIEQPIAIVGMSGVMPQSENLEVFWENLKNAENTMVTEIPEDRWSWKEFYGDPLEEENKTKSKWGGFMKEVDKFDPLFWGISPREAEMMDPQQRIFLEVVWAAIEDSGHKVSDFAGTKTGLFVGAATRDYIDLMASLEVKLDGYSASGTSHAVLANRVSFLLGLQGPSAPLDTACSSSLVALHRAIESIHTGSSEMAIVGGVQVMLTPAGHISFGAAGMLASDGKCKTFDSRADGYVRGEGAGAIVIKPLAKAIEDGDHIYALIKATAENHGGKSTMLTAPNPNAQADLLVEAYEKAEVDPSTVTYIECHGTGTSLGDPIEVQAMKKAFAELYKRNNKTIPAQPHIGLTSAKSNIGHLETSAGIAGILKVLLSIKHQQIPALLHYQALNPYIQLSGTPFYMVDKTKPWDRLIQSDGSPIPRRAGVSSFGFGGANVHIVLEEYIPAVEQTETSEVGPFLIVVSAKTKSSLFAYAERLRDFLQKNPVNMSDLAYTLQIGRDEMPERLGILVDSKEDLIEKLSGLTIASTSNNQVYIGKVSKQKDENQLTSLDEDVTSVIVDKWLSNGNYEKILANWVRGLSFDWMKLYQFEIPRRISLPTYSFARERYWFSLPDKDSNEIKVKSRVHPLLHKNTSVLGVQRFSSYFNKGEQYLKTISDFRSLWLSPWKCLEMTVAGWNLSQSSASPGVLLSDWVLSLPMLVNPAQPVQTEFLPRNTNGDSVTAESEIYAVSEGTLNLFSRCIVTAASSRQSIESTLPRDYQSSSIRLSQNSDDCTLVQQIRSQLSLTGKSYLILDNNRFDSAVQFSWFEWLMDMLFPGLEQAITSEKRLMVRFGQCFFASQIKPEIIEITERQSLELNESACWSGDIVVWSSEGQLSAQIADIECHFDGYVSGILTTGRRQLDYQVAVEAWNAPILVDEPERKLLPTHLVVLGFTDISHLHVLNDEWKSSLIHLAGATNSTSAENYEARCIELVEYLKQSVLQQQNSRVLFLVEKDNLLSGLYGFVRSISMEQPAHRFEWLESDVANITIDVLTKIDPARLFVQQKNARWQLENGKLEICRWKFVDIASVRDLSPFKEKSVYLLTGGLGALGRLLAQEILAISSHSRIVVCGRRTISSLTDEENEFIASHEHLSYRQLELENLKQVQQVINSIQHEFGDIKGILHLAGRHDDKPLTKKSTADYLTTLGPKVTGTYALDEATAHLDLDFFALFSSVVSLAGNAGQSDYAAANGFMDKFACFRSALCSRGQRRGKTLSVNWPLWSEGGMRPPAVIESYIKEATGLDSINTVQGFEALSLALLSEVDQLAILPGDKQKLAAWLNPSAPVEKKNSTEKPVTSPIDASTSRDELRRLLKNDLMLKLGARSSLFHEKLT